jgi:putative chitinase
MVQITSSQLSSILPQCQDPNGWSLALNNSFSKWNITTNKEIACLLGQSAQETGSLNTVIENLNYGSAALLSVFPHEFPTLAMANQYARNPQAIANIVYANRLGNGNTASNDGWTFRGHGILQITGRTAFQNFADAMQMDINSAATYAATQQGAVDAGMWYWSINNLNRFCDGTVQSFINLTKAINGPALLGLQQRENFWHTATKVLGS